MKLQTFVCLTLLLVSCQDNRENLNESSDTVVDTESGYHTSAASRYYYKKRMEEIKILPNTEGGILFLGNSLTEGGDWKSLVGDSTVVIHGISGDVTVGVIQRLNEVIRQHPRSVFLMIGTNDLAQEIEESLIVENINTIVREINNALPQTQVVVQSLLPINPEIDNFPAQFNCNDEINTINILLASNNGGLKYRFADLHYSFTDNAGFLKAEYTPDGIHLNDSGYREWINALQRLGLLE